MRLQAPYSGGFVEAEGELAEQLIAKGYKQADKPEKPEAAKKPTRKRTIAKKEQ